METFGFFIAIVKEDKSYNMKMLPPNKHNLMRSNGFVCLFKLI